MLGAYYSGQSFDAAVLSAAFSRPMVSYFSENMIMKRAMSSGWFMRTCLSQGVQAEGIAGIMKLLDWHTLGVVAEGWGGKFVEDLMFLQINIPCTVWTSLADARSNSTRQGIRECAAAHGTMVWFLLGDYYDGMVDSMASSFIPVVAIA